MAQPGAKSGQSGRSPRSALGSQAAGRGKPCLTLWAPQPITTGPGSPRPALHPLGAQLSWRALPRALSGLFLAVPGLHPGVPCVAASPAPWGYPVTMAQSPSTASCQVSPRSLGPFQVPRWGPGAQRVQGSWQRHPDPQCSRPGTLPKTPDAWAMASLRTDTQAGLPAPPKALWVTLARPLLLWTPSLRP